MKHVFLITTMLLAACAQSAPSKPVETPPPDNQILCTQDAKQCADGSWVGRSGPNCEFVCPNGAKEADK